MNIQKKITYEDAVLELLNIPVWVKKKNSLETIHGFLNRLGNPEKDMKIIHVAGTNGKGSVCAYLTSVLCQAGKRTGTFVSPHLVDIRERFLIQNIMVDKELFLEAYKKIAALSEEALEQGDCYPTFFEFLFLMCMVIFKQAGVEYVILETGMGGRLDTTNVISHPVLTVITSISLDHMQYLGDTISLIAREKAGIIKHGVPVVFDDGCEEASKVIRAAARQNESALYPVKHGEFLTEEKFEAEYKRMDAALAWKALNLLNDPDITEENMLQGIRSTKWPGRMERVLPGVYLDGAHNIGGIEAFVQTVQEKTRQEAVPVSLLFAAVADKEYNKMIHLLCSKLTLKEVFLAHIDSKRALDPAKMLQIFEQEGNCPVSGFSDVGKALQMALKHHRDGELLYCVGSLYLIGEIKHILSMEEKNDRF